MQVRDIADAVETMSAKSGFTREREEVAALAEERAAHRPEVEEAAGSSKEVAILDSRVRKMMDELREELEATDGSIGQAFHYLDLDGDGVVSLEELMGAMESINVKKRPRVGQIKQARAHASG